MSLAETIPGVSRRKSLEKKAERDFYCVIDEIVGFFHLISSELEVHDHEDIPEIREYMTALRIGEYDKAAEIARNSECFFPKLLPELALFPSRPDVRADLDEWRKRYKVYASTDVVA